jgi:signal transduction histidine kinase
VCVRADRKRVAQILSNLLSNAVKFSRPQGCIEIVARHDGRGVEVTMTDHGIGIAPENQARIFEPFEQVSHIPQTGGTGLGLAIARKLAQAHGGNLDVHSELGRGSTFTLWLPHVALPASTD